MQSSSTPAPCWVGWWMIHVNDDTATAFSRHIGNALRCAMSSHYGCGCIHAEPSAAFSPCGSPEKGVRLSIWALPVHCRARVLLWVLLWGCVHSLFLLCARGEVLSGGGVLDDRGTVCRMDAQCKVLPEDRRFGDVKETMTGFRDQISWGCRLEFIWSDTE